MEAKPFFGRKQLLREIVMGVLATRPLDYSLVAPKFCGKTRILEYLASEQGPLLNQDATRPVHFAAPNRVIVTLIDCNWPEASQNLLDFLAQRVETQLKEQKPFAVDWEAISRNTEPSHRLFEMAVLANKASMRLVLLLDNFDALLQKDNLKLEDLEKMRPLTSELALVVSSRQPLHSISQTMVQSRLLGLLTQVFVGLLEPEAAQDWVRAYQQSFPGLDANILDELIIYTGRHPFLLARLRETLLDVQKMLPLDEKIDENNLELIRLRLAEHSRPLFDTLSEAINALPKRINPAAVEALLNAMLRGGITAKDFNGPEQNDAMNWLINQAMVLYQNQKYELFTPLFKEYWAQRRGNPAGDGSVQSPVTAAVSFSTLPRIEGNLLSYFVQRPNQLLSTQQLLADVWGASEDATDRRVQEAIRRLRGHLRAMPAPPGSIVNVRGQGYRFVPASS